MIDERIRLSEHSHSGAMMPTNAELIPRDERISVNHAVEVRLPWLPHAVFEATVLDVSRFGLRLHTHSNLGGCGRLTVEWGQRRLVGTIVYSNKADKGFHVGVKLRPDLRWQERLFRR